MQKVIGLAAALSVALTAWTTEAAEESPTVEAVLNGVVALRAASAAGTGAASSSKSRGSS